MPLEIERKFLVIDESWRDYVHTSIEISQGYLANTEKCSVRIRLAGDKADINIKSMTIGIVRSEYQYPLPVDEAETILNTLCIQPLINKTRHYLSHCGHDWEIDEFNGNNNGLVVAEIELENPDQVIEKPAWLGTEVSEDIRYYNISLVEYPYSQWNSN